MLLLGWCCELGLLGAYKKNWGIIFWVGDCVERDVFSIKRFFFGRWTENFYAYSIR
jgi:hypothetical protein